MMKSERKSASPTSTWFGGTDGVPRALRVSESTTTILVNDVQSSSTDGATPIRVTSRMIESTWLRCPGTLTVTLPFFTVGDCGPVGSVGATGWVRGTVLKDVWTD